MAVTECPTWEQEAGTFGGFGGRAEIISWGMPVPQVAVRINLQLGELCRQFRGFPAPQGAALPEARQEPPPLAADLNLPSPGSQRGP